MLADRQQTVLVFSSSYFVFSFSNPEPFEYEKTKYEDEDENACKSTTNRRVVERRGPRM